MEDTHSLHVVVIPWLAMGHLIPFLEFSKLLAQRGIKISFVSTPKNIQRLPIIPSDISSLINLVTLPLPQVDNLPEDAECTVDLPPHKVQYLKEAFNGLQDPLVNFLEKSVPNWIIYDFTVHWLPPIAAKLGVPCAYLSLVHAALLAWAGPPSVLMGIEVQRKTVEDFLVAPPWIPFPCNLAFRRHEILRVLSSCTKDGTLDGARSPQRGLHIQGSDVVFIRSCREFEHEWIHLLENDIYKKPVIPIGLLPPSVKDRSDKNDEKWEEIGGWLDKQKQESVVYVAIGSESSLSSQEDMTELAFGLELSQLPFFWVIKKLAREAPLVLPEGFEDRISGRGYVCHGWAPQVRILDHPSVGGFLTHCGWNSITESLGFGRVLILLPLLYDQGLNARLMEQKKVGLEVPRDEQDGSFTRNDVAKTLRMVMVDKGGEIFRTNAREMRGIFGNKDLNDRYINNFVEFISNYKYKQSSN